MSPPESSSSTAAEKVHCSICNQRIQGSDWVVCASCDVPIHRACWDYNGKCPIFGCDSTVGRDPLELLLKPKATVSIERSPAVSTGVPAVPRTAEDRTALYLQLDRRKSELDTQLNDMRRRDRAARFHIPGSSMLGFTVLMMFLAPGAWNLWFGMLCFSIVRGLVKQVELRQNAPTRDEIERVLRQVRTLEQYQATIPLPGGTGKESHGDGD